MTLLRSVPLTLGEIRRVAPPADGGRIETGPMQFGGDWPGVFIRGDHCGAIMDRLRHVKTDCPAAKVIIEDIRALLDSSQMK